MSWFNLNVNESLNTLKGQITNVSNVVQEVFTEGILEEDTGTSAENNDSTQINDEVVLGLESANRKIDELSTLCDAKDNEVSFLMP